MLRKQLNFKHAVIRSNIFLLLLKSLDLQHRITFIQGFRFNQSSDKNHNLTLLLFIVIYIISFGSFLQLLFSHSAFHNQLFKNKLQPFIHSKISLSRLAPSAQRVSSAAQPFNLILSKIIIFLSHSAIRPHLFKHFPQPFSHLTSSLPKFSSAIQPFNLIR